VAAVIFDGDGRVLLVKRGRPPREGTWGLPGGLLDLGERLEDGVKREVREECGVEIEVGGLVAAFEPMQWDEAGRLEYHYVVLDYWARLTGGDAAASDDAAALAWVRRDELDAYTLSADTRSVIEAAYSAAQARGTP
jgi:ADP-ribose pyrophosphatase YjhB (NUDIX family)